MRLASLMVVGAVAWSGAAQAERAIPYADMHEVFARVAALQGGKYFKAEARMSSSDPKVPTEAVTLVVRSRGGDIAVPIGADGVARFPLRADLLEENPPVMTNTAPGTLQFKVTITSEAPPVQRFKYALLVAMQDEADAAIAKQGLMARMLLPDFEGLAIQFPAGRAASATVETADGPVRFDAGADGLIHLPYKKAWRKADPWVQLSGMPDKISLDVD